MGFFVIIIVSAKEFSRRTNQQLAKTAFIEQSVNAGKLVSVGDMLAVERQQVLDPRYGSSGNVKRIRGRFLWHQGCRHDLTR